jgi:cytochrome P450 family 6
MTQSFALFEIVTNEGVQEMVRNEIKEILIKTQGTLPFDVVMNEMPYLQQVIFETLRLHPALPTIDRVCASVGGYSLEPFSDFTIPFGMPVYIPVYSIQRDKKYFPEPTKFKPERHSPENKHELGAQTYFPFGGGQRKCLGERFGLMMVKIGIVKLLKDFKLEVTEKTPKEIILAKNSIVVQSENGLYLNFVKDALY